jgi:hypothetical protein
MQRFCNAQRDAMRATGTQRVPRITPTSSHAFSPNLAFPNPNLDSRLLVGLQAVLNSKTGQPDGPFALSAEEHGNQALFLNLQTPIASNREHSAGTSKQ